MDDKIILSSIILSVKFCAIIATRELFLLQSKNCPSDGKTIAGKPDPVVVFSSVGQESTAEILSQLLRPHVLPQFSGRLSLDDSSPILPFLSGVAAIA
ncbi:MAG: hypothetical protein ACREOO_01085 [bacterium]